MNRHRPVVESEKTGSANDPGFGGHHQFWITVAVGLLLLLVTCCSRRSDGGSKAEDGRTTITVWAHHGKPEEWTAIQERAKRFNLAQTNVHAHLVEIAEANYDTQVQSAAASRRLPDVLEFDGPMLANYAWRGYLRPLDTFPAEIKSDLLPSIVRQGTYGGKFYAVGAFDSGLGLFANRSQLTAVNARIPTNVADAWTASEFDVLLARLAEHEKGSGGDGQVLDLKRDYRGEWWTYGFYAILVSAGADLIDRTSYQSASGILNSPKAVEALSNVKQWFKAGYVDPNTDGRSFVDGRTALSWVGHWEYPRYRQMLGEQLVLLPLPNFGRGSRTGMGSWVWGVTRECRNPEAAARFIQFLMRPEEIAAIVAANGAVPARRSVIERSDLYRFGGPLRLFAQQLDQSAVPRPVNPAYPVITSAFQEAMAEIVAGGDVKHALDSAVRTIDQDIHDNDGYVAK